MTGVDTVVIVDPSAKAPEDWYCVATNVGMGPWWTILLTKAGQYRWTLAASKDRERMMAGIRSGKRDGIPGPHAGWLAVAAHPDHGVTIPPFPPPHHEPSGRFVPMTPKRIPFCGTENEVLDRVRLTAARDKEFAKKWAGWRFLAIRHDDGVLL